MRAILSVSVLVFSCIWATAQQLEAGAERRVPLSETAVAVDSRGAPALVASLRTTALTGSVDSPVTNIRLVIRNSSGIPYAFVSGLVTFYDSSGVRCGEGLFKADALSANEAFETDTPGIRIRCAPVNWRIVASNLLPRVAPEPVSAGPAASRSILNLIISVDGEEHPIQLEKPMVLILGNTQRTLVVRLAP